MKTHEVKKYHRALTLDTTEGISGECVITLSVASAQPVRMGPAFEVLSFKPGAVDLTRLNSAASVLYNHDENNQIGVVEKAWIDEGSQRLYATIRFSQNEFAQEVYRDVVDGIRRNVSIGYTFDHRKDVS